eukprot:symbB.v1.2.023730.t1/scaffold2195.1/size86141/2
MAEPSGLIPWRTAVYRLHQPLPSVSVAAVCIGSCCRAVAWQPSLAVLHSIEEHRIFADTVAFNGAMTACSKELYWMIVVDLLVAMGYSDVRSNAISYTSVLKSLGSMASWARGSYQLQEAKAKGLRLHLFLRTASSTLCATVGAWEKANTLAPRADDDIVARNSVLSACGRRRAWSEAIGFYVSLAQRAIEASQKSLTAVASSMSEASWKQENHMISEKPCHWSHSLFLARQAKADLTAQRCLGREFTAAVITSCTRRLEGPDAILQGASMQTAGLALLWSRVLAILRTTATATTGLCNIAITACARSSQVAQAWMLLEKMLRADGPQPDVQSFNCLMGVLPEKKELVWPLAMHLVMRLHQCNIRADRLTLNNALAANSRQRCWLHALRLLGASHLPAPGLVAYNIAMEASCRQPPLVLAFFHEMHVRSLIPDESWSVPSVWLQRLARSLEGWIWVPPIWALAMKRKKESPKAKAKENGAKKPPMAKWQRDRLVRLNQVIARAARYKKMKQAARTSYP